MAVGESHRMRVEAVGTSLKVYVDDMTTPRISVTDDSHTSGATGVHVGPGRTRRGPPTATRRRGPRASTTSPSTRRRPRGEVTAPRRRNDRPPSHRRAGGPESPEALPG
ncbi:hypothetical protein NKH77_08750 [Streptomyces sp. M19]